MKKPLTPEQLAASAERKARLRSICKTIADMPEGERLALAGRMNPITVEGRQLSLHNTLMVAMQNPSATVVGGSHQWRQAGRQVRKGEHGIGIWVPKFAGKTADESGELDGFLFGTVFDISQTEAREAAEV